MRGHPEHTPDCQQYPVSASSAKQLPPRVPGMRDVSVRMLGLNLEPPCSSIWEFNHSTFLPSSVPGRAPAFYAILVFHVGETGPQC